MISARVLAFGSFDPAMWGVAWIPGDRGTTPLAVGTGTSAAVVSGELDATGAEWRFEGADVSLTIAPAGPSRTGHASEGRLTSDDSLCVVSGRLVRDGETHDLSCPGWRSTIQADLATDQLDSFRQVVGWIGSDDGVALLSLRPRKARGHEGDVVLATVLEARPVAAVVDPRLSTTYTAAGTPQRTSLELWFEEASPEDEDGDASPYPRRAAGEAIGAHIDWDVSGFSLHAELLRWHTRGEEGAGVYLLGRRR